MSQKLAATKWTKTQLCVFFVVVLLAVDEINPVKLVLHVFPALEAWEIAAACSVIMLYIFISDLKDMVYFGIKIFFHSILSIFFRSVETVGREHIPPHGPVLFAINHANQFMDAVMVLCTCQRTVSYLMAEASWKRRIIGDIAWALGVVPVKRAQDDAFLGLGRIKFQSLAINKQGEQELQVVGINTKFTSQLAVGDKIRPPSTPFGFKIVVLESDTLMIVNATDMPHGYQWPTTEVTYDILKHTPLNVVFQKVLEKLEANGAVGIFPEGGSHDRTDLLPLKVGVALIAYSALEQDGLSVPIVPVGLNYFRAHRWRGRAVVEYGRPIHVNVAKLEDFKAGGKKRRDVCNALLEDIESSMRSVIVSTTDYDTMELIQTARRLYQRRKGPMDSSEKQDLSRRFAEGYRRLLLMTEGKPPPEWIDLQDRLMAYRNELRDLGLKDYQVLALSGEHLEEPIDVSSVDGDVVLSILQLIYNIAHLLILLLLAAVPVVFLNLPVGILAGLYSERRRIKALANSKVKVRGYDVMLTEKVVFCLVMVPVLWLLYAALLYFGTKLDGPTIALAILSMPAFAYVGIIVADAGMVDMQDLRPFFMRLFPSSRRRLAQLPKKRKQLQDDLRLFIRSIGPAMGEIYYAKELDWKNILEKAKSN